MQNARKQSNTRSRSSSSKPLKSALKKSGGRRNQEKIENIFDATLKNAKDIKVPQDSKPLSIDQLSIILTADGDKDIIEKFSRGEHQIYTNVRQLTVESELMPQAMIRDFSVKSGMQGEDQVFALSDSALWTNVRTGNTLIDIYDADDFEKYVKTIMARRGVNQIFDLQTSFVDKVHRNSVDNLASIQAKTKVLMLGPVKKALAHSDNRIEIVQTVKTNGDAAFISWVSDLEAWLIASKNVSLLAPNKQDVLDLYPENSRYHLARLIALTWFDMLKKVPNVKQLIKDIDGLTLAGDFIGAKELTNLIRYQERTIAFHSVIVNNCKDINPCKANGHQLLKNHNLDCLPVSSLGVCDNFDQVCDTLIQAHATVSGHSINQTEEGVVLHFVQHSSNGQSHTVSMCKIKSLEFLLLKEIIHIMQRTVEKASNSSSASSREIGSDQVFGQFIRASKAICKDFQMSKLPHPDSFYFDLFSQSYNIVFRSQRRDDKDYYRDLLFNDKGKFFEEVIKSNDEKNQGRKYIGKINFKSSFSFDQREQIFKPMKPSLKPKQTTPKDETPKQKRNNSETKSTTKTQNKRRNNRNGEFIVVVCPPLGVTKQITDKLQTMFNFIEADKFNQDLVPEQRRNQPTNLLWLASLEGLDSIPEGQASVHAFKLTDKTKEDFAKSFYLQKDNYFVQSKFKKDLSSRSIRNVVDQQMKLINQNHILKRMGDSFKGMFTDEKALFNELSKYSSGKVVKKEPVVQEQQPKKSQRVQQSTVKDDNKAAKISTQFLEEEIQNLQVVTESDRKILVILPVSIPGVGKTSFIDTHLKRSLPKSSFTTILKDDIRKDCIDQWLVENNGKNSDQAYKSTTDQTMKIFQNQLTKALHSADRVKQPKNQDNLHVIYVDQNHSPSVLEQALEIIDDFNSKRKNKAIKVGMVPQMAEGCQYKNYPFSLNFLVQCYIRCLERQGHPTLSSEDPQRLAKILLLFFKQFEGFNFNDEMLLKYGLDELMPVPLTYEHSLLELPANLKKEIETLIQSDILTAKGNDAMAKFCKLVDIQRAFYQKSPGFNEPHSVNSTQYDFLKQIRSFKKNEVPQTTFVQKKTEPKIEENHDNEGPEEQAVSSHTPSEHDQQEQHLQFQDEEEVKETPMSSDKNEEEHDDQEDSVTKEQMLKFAQGQSKNQNRKQKRHGQKDDNPQQQNVQKTVVKAVKEYQPKAMISKKTDDGEWEQTDDKKSKKMAQNDFSDSDDDADMRIPLYLAVVLELPNQAASKQALQTIILDNFQRLSVKVPNSQLEEETKYLNALLSDTPSGKSTGGWKMLPDLHMTVYFMGRKEEYIDEDLFRDFEEDQIVEVKIVAFVYVPQKLIAAVCFPDYPSANKCPHITLLTNELAPKFSNNLLEQTCLRNGNFKANYEALRKGQQVPENKEVLKGSCNFPQNPTSSTAYFVTLPEPITYTGVTKTTY